MIRLLPVPPDRLPAFCRGKGLDPSGATAYAAWQGERLLGWCAIGEGDPCPVLGLEAEDASLAPKNMLPLALATSIDALAVGVGFAFLDVNIGAAAGFIGVVTFLLSAAGVKVGGVFGAKYKNRAEIAGGVILILLGTKILLEHLGLLAF